MVRGTWGGELAGSERGSIMKSSRLPITRPAHRFDASIGSSELGSQAGDVYVDRVRTDRVGFVRPSMKRYRSSLDHGRALSNQQLDDRELSRGEVRRRASNPRLAGRGIDRERSAAQDRLAIPNWPAQQGADPSEQLAVVEP